MARLGASVYPEQEKIEEIDAILINNKDGIHIEMSAAFVDLIEKAIANRANIENLSIDLQLRHFTISFNITTIRSDVLYKKEKEICYA